MHDSQILQSTGSWRPQIRIHGIYHRFLIISMHILLDLISPGSAEAVIGGGGNLDSHLIASCTRNVCQKLLKSDNQASSYGQ